MTLFDLECQKANPILSRVTDESWNENVTSLNEIVPKQSVTIKRDPRKLR